MFNYISTTTILGSTVQKYMIGGMDGCMIAQGLNKNKYRDLMKISSGVLKQKEFTKMYEKFFPANDANTFANNVFRNFDADKNGSIDFTEFMIAIDVTSSGEPREKLMWAFR